MNENIWLCGRNDSEKTYIGQNHHYSSVKRGTHKDVHINIIFIIVVNVMVLWRNCSLRYHLGTLDSQISTVFFQSDLSTTLLPETLSCSEPLEQHFPGLLLTADSPFLNSSSSPWSLNSHILWASLVAQLIKNLPAMQETPVWFLVQEDLLENG